MDAPVVACGGRHGVCKDDGYRSGGRRHALNSFGGLCGFVVACRGLLLQLHHWLHFLYSGLMCLCVFVCLLLAAALDLVLCVGHRRQMHRCHFLAGSDGSVIVQSLSFDELGVAAVLDAVLPSMLL